MKDFYDKLIRLSYVIRYSNVPRIKNESVAEHSFHVAAIVVMLYHEYRFNLGEALLAAVSHDIPEFAIGDVTVETKQNFPEMAACLNKMEKQVIDELPVWFKQGMCTFNGRSTEGFIVQLADAIQVKQYAEKEVKLGNDGYMQDVVEHSSKRINDLRWILEEVRR